MPRPKRPGAPAPKPRSRHGCWPCKRRKIKCNEEKPACSNCLRQGDTCDYSIRLNWEGRTKRKAPEPATPGSNSEFVSYLPNFQQSPLIPGADLTSPVEAHATSRSEWSVASSPYANNAGNVWISRATPVSPPSISAKSPAGSDEHSIASISHTISTDNPNVRSMPERVMPSPEFSSSLLVHDNTRSSQAYPFPGSSDFDSAGLSFNPLSSFSFETNSVSQPVSFLRDSSAVEVVTSSQNNGYRAKRYKRQDGNVDHQNQQSAADEMISPSLGQDIDRTFANSLLSHTIFGMSPPTEPEKRQPVVSGHEIFYGFDCGSPDFDLNKNNDTEAIAPISPSEEVFADDDISPASEQMPIGSLHVRRRSSFTTGGGYYVTPVRVKIPRRMTPLPKLLDNPMNLLYFHHFIDHTARILVPHDCDQNAFLKVLPAMAITDPNLLNLMLAYSASHRARFLRYPEPSNRIAHWVRDVFPTLRHALTEPEEKVTDSHLATAVMLLSLKIVSPNTFEVPITWQTHLKLARDLFEACGIQHRARPENKVAYFLAHWFGYLDIFGSLSCRTSGSPLLQTNYWSTSIPGIPVGIDGYQDFDDNDDNNYRVDCFSGYTPRTGAHLARLAHLTHYCEEQRFDDEVGNFLPHWTPSEDVIAAGNALLEDMHRTRQRGHVLGTHHTELEDHEMIAIDLAFHWSAVVHIHRRVLGSSTYSTEVREAVNNLCSAIARIRSGSSTECSVLFPLFTAGCESRDPQQRLEMMTRVMNFEAEGLKQFKNARKLMQRCWEEDLPWMALAHGEFLG